MCHELWRRRDERREERFDEELKYLLDEESRKAERPLPVMEEEPPEPEPERAQEEPASRV